MRVPRAIKQYRNFWRRTGEFPEATTGLESPKAKLGLRILAPRFGEIWDIAASILACLSNGSVPLHVSKVEPEVTTYMDIVPPERADHSFYLIHRCPVKQ
jgi:hypothetical protein